MNTPKRYALLDPSGTVLNIVVWDGVTPYEPDGSLVEVPDSVQIGDTL